jgi:oxygen-independent coproporphyrinogen-3 oxidase
LPISLYLHIPFCAHRCAYCDFNTYAGQESAIPAYVEALCREIQIVGLSVERSESEVETPGSASAVEAPGAERSASAVEARLSVATIFFGGGTPSLLTPAHYRDIFQAIHRHFDVLPEAEISLEANPGTVSPGYLRELREIGFNRISYGVQSANPTELRLLERIHTYSDVVDAVRWSRSAGFENLNLDLMYGLPEQSLAAWQRTVELILGLRPEHISAYALTLEHGTPFGRWARKGLLPLPDPDLAAAMYEWLDEYLSRNDYAQYEISNWARSKDESQKMKDETEREFSSRMVHPSSFQCRHNLQYWRNLPYLGLGAGAHGYAGGVRYSNVLRIKTYIERLKTADCSQIAGNWPLSPAAVNHHRNSPREDMDETMITGLRLTIEGVSAETFRRRFGVELTDIYGEKIDRLVKLNLLQWDSGRLRLTPPGRLLGNQVFMQFVGD